MKYFGRFYLFIYFIFYFFLYNDVCVVDAYRGIEILEGKVDHYLFIGVNKEFIIDYLSSHKKNKYYSAFLKKVFF